MKTDKQQKTRSGIFRKKYVEKLYVKNVTLTKNSKKTSKLYK